MKSQKIKNNRPRPFSIERLPTGEKVMRIWARKRRQKLDEKLMLAEIEKIFRKA